MSDEMTEVHTTSIKEIMDEVVTGAEAHSAATEIFMTNFIFYNKSLTEWLDEMAVEMPTEIQPEHLQRVNADIAKKIQRASNFYTIANSIHGGIVGGGNIKKATL